MPERIQRHYTPSQKKREQEQVSSSPSKIDAEKVKAELDELLDEIDEVLEENAEEFVAAYVQKGGE